MQELQMEHLSKMKKVYYVYALTMDGRTQTGIVACSDLDDYQNNIIKKHENTRESKEQDRIINVSYTDAHTGPIFLVYRQSENSSSGRECQSERSNLFFCCR